MGKVEDKDHTKKCCLILITQANHKYKCAFQIPLKTPEHLMLN